MSSSAALGLSRQEWHPGVEDKIWSATPQCFGGACVDRSVLRATRPFPQRQVCPRQRATPHQSARGVVLFGSDRTTRVRSDPAWGASQKHGRPPRLARDQRDTVLQGTVLASSASEPENDASKADVGVVGAYQRNSQPRNRQHPMWASLVSAQQERVLKRRGISQPLLMAPMATWRNG